MKRLHNSARGFTLVEVVISLSIAGVLSGILFMVTYYFYANMMQNNAATQMTLDTQIVLRSLTDDIRLADKIDSTNAITDANQPSGWTTSNPSSILIISDPAVNSSNQIIYNPDTGYPYRNENIYFVSSGTLYKRTLKNPDATGNVAVTTCPPAIATSSCPPDKTFSTYVSSLQFSFHDATDASTADVTLARSVDFTVAMSATVYGRNMSTSNSSRVTMRNQ